MQPIYTGEVKPDGIDLNFLRIEQPRPIFDRMSGGEEFDVAEYSSSEYVQRYANKKCNFVAIPVFPSRCFRHAFIGINKNKIKKPKDLEGKRIGVALYTMTAAISIRGILQHDHGVDFSKVTLGAGCHQLGRSAWLTDGPAAAQADQASNRAHTTSRSNDLIQDGTVDATMGTSMPESFRTNPNIGRLFPDFVERRTRSLQAHQNLSDHASGRDQRSRSTRSTRSWQPACSTPSSAPRRSRSSACITSARCATCCPGCRANIDEIYEYFGGDPWPYGVEPNRPTLEALVQYLQDQHLTDWKPKLEELFAPIYGQE